MNLNYCPVCGTKLHPKEQPHEAPALYCDRCAEYRFPIYSAAVAVTVLDEAGEVVKEANVLGLGNLITFIIDFIIVAFICFLIVKAFNKAKDKAEAKKKAEEAAAAAKAAEEEAAKPKAPTTEELLAEIRDLLAKK